jgi:predicted nuclease with TOPRIM domain
MKNNNNPNIPESNPKIAPPFIPKPIESKSKPKHFDSVIDMLVHNCNEYANKIDELEAEIQRLKEQPDALTAYLYAAELGKDTVKKLKNENAFLKMEVERLKNNIAYLDTKLDEELDGNK